MYNILLSAIADAAYTAANSHLDFLQKKMSRRTYDRIRTLCYNYNPSNQQSQYALLEYMFRCFKYDFLVTSDKNDLKLLFEKELCNFMSDILIDRIMENKSSRDILLDRFILNYRLLRQNYNNKF